jgi:hypothetical protein
MGEKNNAYRVFVGKSEGNRPLGRPRHMWEDNIKMDLREIGGLHSFDLGQGLLVSIVLNLRVP